MIATIASAKAYQPNQIAVDAFAKDQNNRSKLVRGNENDDTGHRKEHD